MIDEVHTPDSSRYWIKGNEKEFNNINIEEADKFLALALHHELDLTVVGLEQALACGIVDTFCW